MVETLDSLSKVKVTVGSQGLKFGNNNLLSYFHITGRNVHSDERVCRI